MIMPDYGPQITNNALLDRLYKQKTWLTTRIQYGILDLFGRLPAALNIDRIFAQISRKLVGGYLYSIKLEVNTACTLRCKMCYISNASRELPLHVIKKILDRIRSYNIRLEILGGEPLQRNDIIEIITYAKHRSKIPFVSLYTNGLFADRKMARNLNDAGLDAAIVTLISHKAEIHDAFAGQVGSWARTVENIGLLSQAGVPVYTFTAIHRENYRDYKEIYAFVKHSLKTNALFYQYVPQKQNDPLMISPEAWHEIKHWILLEKNKVHTAFISKFYMLTGNACSGGNFVFTIKADGSVQPCPFISDLSLGNIYERDIWDIVKNRFSHQHLIKFKEVPLECQACSHKSVCGGGCRAGNNLLFGDYAHKDHRCLGPYNRKIERETLVDCIPSFF